MAGSTFASRSYRDVGIVLRTQKLGEADRIITVLTALNGVVRAVAKGIRRTSSKFGATLEPFMLSDIQFVHGRNLDIITQTQARNSYGSDIAADYEKYTVASAMTEMTERLAESSGERDKRQFDLLHGGLSALARSVHPADVILDSFMLRMLATAGWEVTWSHCVHCLRQGPHTGFSSVSGGPVCADCRPPGTLNLQTGTVDFLAALQQGRWENTRGAAADIRHEATSVVIDYTQYHLERPLSAVHAFHQGQY